MSVSRLHRALALPALAIVVSAGFVAVLASNWLAVEREAARLRGAEAATAALEGLREGLRRAVAQAAAEVLPQLRTEPHAWADPDSGLPPLVAEAFLIDNRGTVRATPKFTGATSDHAAPILAAGARAMTTGRTAEADKFAAQLLVCCAGARDEFGVSYGIYAAWQRLAIDARQPERSRPLEVVRALREAIDAGHLSEPGDVTGIRMLSVRLADAPGAAALVELVEQRVAAAAGRKQAVRTAEGWLESLNWEVEPKTVPVQIARWTAPNTLAAAWRATPDDTVVLRLDTDALEKWTSQWSSPGSPFVFTLDANETATGFRDSDLTIPLFVEAPALKVSVRRGSNTAADDHRREQLFIMAASAVLALTLVAGYFATRDVFRELRMASLRSAFLAGVTHEIKTPLTSIRLLAETLQQRRVSPAESDELLTTIVNEAEHLSGLVDNVLGTSRIETGTRTYQMNPVVLGDVVRNAHRRFHYTLTKEGFTLVESISPTPIWVHADAEALAQALLNLLGNATKYSGRSREIRLSVTATDRHGLVTVADDGIGVPAREHSRIFDGFYRARATVETTTGTGLGLALVKHFADAHRGSITLESEPGRGSTFTLSLPLIAAPLTQESANG